MLKQFLNITVYENSFKEALNQNMFYSYIIFKTKKLLIQKTKMTNIKMQQMKNIKQYPNISKRP
jgi:hypothetical protein